MKMLSLLFVVAGLLAAGCGDDSPPGLNPSGPALFRIRYDTPPNDLFRVEITDSLTVLEAERLLQSGEGRFVAGRPLRGDGGFNAPWNWHLDPNTVVFAEGTVEACQTSPGALEGSAWTTGFGSATPASAARSWPGNTEQPARRRRACFDESIS